MNVAARLSLTEDDHGLLVTGKVDQTPTAEQVYNLVKSRRLNQLSFAYDTIDSAPAKAADDVGTVNELRQVRLYEVSLVPVGANQDTSVIAVKSAPNRAATETLTLRLRILSANT
jgi:HK97 family phage prohead protease